MVVESQFSRLVDSSNSEATLKEVLHLIAFLREYYKGDPARGAGEMKDFADVLHCTGLTAKVSEVDFSSMQRNIDYLRNILAHHQEDFIQCLRRGNMIEKLAWKDQEALGFFKVEPSGFSSPYR